MGWAWPLVAAAALMVTGCSGSSQAGPSPSLGPASVVPSPSSKASVVAGGCASSQVYRGGIPQWINSATGNNTPDIPYTVASPPIAAGFIFGYPLRSGHPDPSNKILWVVGKPRNGSSLLITGQLVGESDPTVHQTEPPDSDGEIYPSIVDVPKPGCWRFELAWSGEHATVFLEYQ